MGALSKSGSNQSIAIGYLSEAKGTNAASGGGNPGTAVGAGAKSIGAGTSAYGLSAFAMADYATAIGKSANAAAINFVSFTHLPAPENKRDVVCRVLAEKKTTDYQV